jgi:hypothetical protein
MPMSTVRMTTSWLKRDHSLPPNELDTQDVAGSMGRPALNLGEPWPRRRGTRSTRVAMPPAPYRFRFARGAARFYQEEVRAVSVGEALDGLTGDVGDEIGVLVVVEYDKAGTLGERSDDQVWDNRARLTNAIVAGA